jgi:O-antigen ligase
MTPKLVAAVTLFLVMLSEKWRVNKSSNLVNWSLVLFLVLGLLTSFQAVQPQLALWGWWRLLLAGWLLVISQVFFQKQRNRQFFIKYLITGLVFFGLIGSMQFITKQPLGLFLEDQLQIAPFGRLTNESQLVYRVSGLVGHPTFFASFISLLLPVSLAGLIWGKRGKALMAVASLLGFVSLFGSFSRSSWLALLLIGLIFSGYWLVKKKQLGKAVMIKVLLLNLVGFLVIFSGLLQARLQSFKYIWSLGSGRGRLVLLKEAGEMIRNSPVWGVGLNHFTRVMRETSSDPEVLSLLYPVHNTFILFFSELGLIGGLLFVVVVSGVFWLSYKKAFKNWQRLGVLVGALTFVVNAQFHTLFDSDPSLELFMVMAGFLLSL